MATSAMRLLTNRACNELILPIGGVSMGRDCYRWVLLVYIFVAFFKFISWIRVHLTHNKRLLGLVTNNVPISRIAPLILLMKKTDHCTINNVLATVESAAAITYCSPVSVQVTNGRLQTRNRTNI